MKTITMLLKILLVMAFGGLYYWGATSSLSYLFDDLYARYKDVISIVIIVLLVVQFVLKGDSKVINFTGLLISVLMLYALIHYLITG